MSDLTTSILWKKGWRINSKNEWYKPVGPVVPAEPKQNPLPALECKPQECGGSKRRVAVCVTLVRFGHKLLDEDNLVSSFKPLRDAIAKSIGLDDADKRLRWEYGQVQTQGDTGTNVKISLKEL